MSFLKAYKASTPETIAIKIGEDEIKFSALSLRNRAEFEKQTGTNLVTMRIKLQTRMQKEAVDVGVEWLAENPNRDIEKLSKADERALMFRAAQKLGNYADEILDKFTSHDILTSLKMSLNQVYDGEIKIGEDSAKIDEQFVDWLVGQLPPQDVHRIFFFVVGLGSGEEADVGFAQIYREGKKKKRSRKKSIGKQ